jgi:hypothetical protein
MRSATVAAWALRLLGAGFLVFGLLFAVSRGIMKIQECASSASGWADRQ